MTRLSLDAEVDSEAMLAFVPGPRLPADDSRVASFQRFQLASSASLVGVVDWIDMRHDFFSYNSVSTIFIEEVHQPVPPDTTPTPSSCDAPAYSHLLSRPLRTPLAGRPDSRGDEP